MHSDHYQALGISPGASSAEIRAAYRRLMREHHPDRRPGDEAAEAHARRLNAAWEVLRDDARRAAYDRLRSPGAAAPVPPREGPSGWREPGAAIVHVGRNPQQAAYSAERDRFQQSFSRACWRVGVAVLAGGGFTLLLSG